MIARMKKVTLLGLSSDKKAVVHAVVRMGLLHMEDTLPEEEKALLEEDSSRFWTEKYTAQVQKMADAIAFLDLYDHTKKPLFAQKRPVSRAEFDQNAARMDAVVQKAERVLRLKQSVHNLKQLENQLQTERTAYRPWLAFDVFMDTDGTQHTTILTGTLSKEVDLSALQSALSEGAPLCLMEPVSEDRTRRYVAVLFHRSETQAVMDLLKTAGFAQVSFEKFHGKVSDYCRLLQQDLDDVLEQQTVLEKMAEEFVSGLPDFQMMYDYLSYRREAMRVMESAAHTDSVFVLTGYIPEEKQSEFCARLEKKYPVWVEVEEIPEGEEFPVLIENNALVRPFEVITDLFSVPSSLSVDSNAVMAIFYFIFFGMMISDAGYGILLALMTGVVLFRYKLSGMMKQMFQLMFLGGISTFLWGALFGGWFGDLISQLSGGSFTLKPLWFNPLDDPMRLLVVSLVLGGVHLMAGMAIEAYKRIKRGQLWDAVFDIGSWYLVLIGLALCFLGGTFFTVGISLAAAGAVMLILTQGRAEKNIVKRLFKGIMSLYDITSYLSDILSYSRLLALGLATGVIATVVNTMSVMGGRNIIGFIVLVLGLVVGHLFNMSINILGAFVHASRLQYVEFFGKFFEGGGEKYDPVKVKSKYIEVEQK